MLGVDLSEVTGGFRSGQTRCWPGSAVHGPEGTGDRLLCIVLTDGRIEDKVTDRYSQR
jgi:hypothetical protein